MSLLVLVFKRRIKLNFRIIVAATAIALTGCGDESKIEKAVEAKLIDPYSVHFGDVVISKNKDRACIEFNAKNRMGAYTGYKIAKLYKLGDEWIIKNLNESSYKCGQGHFEEEDMAKEKAIDFMVERYGRLKSILADKKIESHENLSGLCEELYYNAAEVGREVENAIEELESTDYLLKRLDAAEAKLREAKCG